METIAHFSINTESAEFGVRVWTKQIEKRYTKNRYSFHFICEFLSAGRELIFLRAKLCSIYLFIIFCSLFCSLKNFMQSQIGNNLCVVSLDALSSEINEKKIVKYKIRIEKVQHRKKLAFGLNF